MSDSKNHDTLVLGKDRETLFSLSESLGEGKAGSVSLATVVAPVLGLRPGMKVALKRYKPWVLDLDDHRRRIEREAAVSAKILHPNVVKVFGLIDTLRGPCLVMEYVAGGTLRNLRTRSRSRITAYSTQLLEGLAAVHRAGQIHRDIKPDNLLITEDRAELKIADFGVMKNMQETTETTRHAFLGTIRYAAPEYLFEGRSTRRSDQYSAAAVIYELWTRKPLVQSSGTSASAVLEIGKRQQPRPGELEPTSVTSAVRAAVICRMLRARPISRFLNVRAALTAFGEGPSSAWWQAKVRAQRRRFERAAAKARREATAARERLERLKAKWSYSDLVRFADARKDDFYAVAMIDPGDNPFGDEYDSGREARKDWTCPVCDYTNFASPDCCLCDYFPGELAEWEELKQSPDSDGAFFDKVALASTFEGHERLPSKATLERVERLSEP